MIDIYRLYEALLPAVREGGYIARSLQGKVINVGKESEVLENDSEYWIKKRQAKTVVDDMVQEILLQTVYSLGIADELYIDAEERTASLRLFPEKPTGTTLVIDPIDGTDEYLKNRGNYSVCVGCIQNNDVIFALVYFPSRDHLYGLDLSGVAYEIEHFSDPRSEAVPLVSPAAITKTVYKNSRVPEAIVARLRDAGYTVYDDTDRELGVSDMFLKCIRGEVDAYISYTRQTRDILLGVILAHLSSGSITDWSGQRLHFPNEGGRIPRMVFWSGAVDTKLVECLCEEV